MNIRHLNLSIITPLEEKFAAICFVRVPGSLLYRVRTIPDDIDLDIDEITITLTRMCTIVRKGIWYFRLQSEEEMDIVCRTLQDAPIIFFDPEHGDLTLKYQQLN